MTIFGFRKIILAEVQSMEKVGVVQGEETIRKSSWLHEK